MTAPCFTNARLAAIREQLASERPKDADAAAVGRALCEKHLDRVNSRPGQPVILSLAGAREIARAFFMYHGPIVVSVQFRVNFTTPENPCIHDLWAEIGENDASGVDFYFHNRYAS